MNLRSIIVQSMLALFSWSFWFSCEALAAPAVKVECPSLENLMEEAEECSDNGRFGEAGISCVKALEDAIRQQAELARASMKASNEKHTGEQAGNAQTHNFAGSGANYQISRTTLEELIAAAKGTRASVNSYLNGIYYPEDFDAPEEVIGDPIEFLDNNACYNDNRIGLENLVKQVDKKIAELEAALSESQKRETGSNQREIGQGTAGLGKVTGGKNTGPPKPLPSGSAKGGASPRTKSDITGTKESKEKEILGEFLIRDQLIRSQGNDKK